MLGTTGPVAESHGVWRRALTMVDVAVAAAAVAVVALLMLPVLRVARGEARTVTCTTQLQSFGQLMAVFAAENEDWLPGVNTTGVALRELAFLMSSDPNVLADPNLPVTSSDWMTPLLRQSEVLPARRAQKWGYLWTQYRCPAQDESSIVYQGSAPPDKDEFVAMSPWPACSYLMPAAFQYWGSNPNHPFGPEIGRKIIPELPPEAWPRIYATQWPHQWEVKTPASFSPKLTAVGPADRKIFVADGTRYMDADLMVVHDISPVPSYFGAFSSAGGWYSAGSAYGVASGSENWDGDIVSDGSRSGGHNLGLSYRHFRADPRPARATFAPFAAIEGPLAALDTLEFNWVPPQTHAKGNVGAINAAFFDGHVGRMRDQASRSPQLWYPTGSVVNYDTDTMTTLPVGTVIP